MILFVTTSVALNCLSILGLDKSSRKESWDEARGASKHYEDLEGAHREDLSAEERDQWCLPVCRQCCSAQNQNRCMYNMQLCEVIVSIGFITL